MSRSTFKRDTQGIAEFLKSTEIAEAVRAQAEKIAANVRSSTEAEVVVDSYVTDRAAASVTIKDPRAKLLEVRDGVLSRAAASTGLEVRRK